MNRLLQLIQANNLRPVDAIVLKKKILGMADHYAIFYGYRHDRPVFIANYGIGVREVSDRDMLEYMQFLQPERIEYFQGNDFDRQAAWQRAHSRLGERAYDYIANNCEHFKNWVHYGSNHSNQVSDVGTIAIAGGVTSALAGLASKDDRLVVAGIGGLLIGSLLKYFGEEK